MLLYETLRRSMRRHPGTVVRSSREATTFADLLREADAKAAALDVAPSRVLITQGNHPGYVSTLLAVLSRGHLPILADPALTPREIDELVAGCGIDLLIQDDTARPVPTGWRGDRPATDPRTELCRLTSGSTRSPGCIEFSGEAVLNAARTWARASGLGPSDTSLCFAGLYNGLAFNTTLIPSLLTGAGLVLPGGLPSAGTILRTVTATSPTILVAFPAAYERLTSRQARDLGSDTLRALRGIRLRLSSAAPLPDSVAAHVAELSGPISDYYGIAETGPVTFNEDPRGTGGQGRLLPGVRVTSRPRPSDGVAVLHVHTRSMGTKYLNYPGEFEQAIAPDGAYVTSDVGTVTADGRLHLEGRALPTLNIGGRKFTAESVRRPLLEHPDVIDAFVTHLTTPSGRDCVGAAVETVTELEVPKLRRYLMDAVSAYKVPEVLVVTDRLPRGASGKVKAAETRALLAAAFDRPAEEEQR
ncbi:MAG TPA: class I adenylate-forming enzyme family protein [Thermomonospora sp.]|nr:class I adenylate-forming enzyme family protein [Thermomonospora sp.]